MTAAQLVLFEAPPTADDEPGVTGDVWEDRFTDGGDYARVEPNVKTGTFRFLRTPKEG